MKNGKKVIFVFKQVDDCFGQLCSKNEEEMPLPSTQLSQMILRSHFRSVLLGRTAPQASSSLQGGCSQPRRLEKDVYFYSAKDRVKSAMLYRCMCGYVHRIV